MVIHIHRLSIMLCCGYLVHISLIKLSLEQDDHPLFRRLCSCGTADYEVEWMDAHRIRGSVVHGKDVGYVNVNYCSSLCKVSTSQTPSARTHTYLSYSNSYFLSLDG